jgi:hypothetical protein
LAANELAKETTLYVFSDGPKKPEAAAKVEEVRQYVRSIANAGMFADVKVVEAEKNRGLAKSIIAGVTAVMKDAGQAIVLEDDLITAPDFLRYMNDGLTFYRDKPQVGSITAYTTPLDIPADYKESVYALPRTCSLGWGTWADRWEKVDWDVKDFEQFRRDPGARKRFDAAGPDRFDRLRRQLEHDVDSWSVRFGYAQFRQGYVTIYPVVCRLQNIGADGSGVHLNCEALVGSVSDKPTPYTLSLPEIDPRIMRQVWRLYAGGISSQVARYLRNNGLAGVEASVKRLVRRR